MQWNKNVAIATNFLSQAALEVMKISSAASDEKFVEDNISVLLRKCQYQIAQLCCFGFLWLELLSLFEIDPMQFNHKARCVIIGYCVNKIKAGIGRYKFGIRCYNKTTCQVAVVGSTQETEAHNTMIWKHFPRYWCFFRLIHRLPLVFPHKEPVNQSSFLRTDNSKWTNNGGAGDLRPHDAYVTSL